MATETEKEKEAEVEELTFKCKSCGQSKPLDEMMILSRFFPPIVACRDCEKKIR